MVQQDFYRQYRFADAFAQVNSIPVSRVERLTAIEGIQKASGRLTVTARLVADSQDNNATLKLISYDPAETDRLNDIFVTKGEAPVAGSYGICLNEAFYKANNLKQGDTIELALGGRRISFTVCGTIQTPEYIYIMPEGSLMPDDKNYGIAYVSADVLEALLNRRGEANDVSFALKSGVSYDDVEQELKTALAPNGLIQLIPRADQGSHSMLDQEIAGLRSMVGVVPFLFLMVGALIMSVVMKRIVEQQHAQIGLMKAYGYSNREVLIHYAIYGVVIGLMASIIGGALGATVAGYMAALYTTYFYMPGISRLLLTIKCIHAFCNGVVIRRGCKLIRRARRAKTYRRRIHASARTAQRQAYSAGAIAGCMEIAAHHHTAFPSKPVSFPRAFRADLDRADHLLCAHCGCICL